MLAALAVLVPVSSLLASQGAVRLKVESTKVAGEGFTAERSVPRLVVVDPKAKALASFADGALAAFEKARMDGWIRQARIDWVDLKPLNLPNRMSYESTTKIVFNQPDLLSFRSETYRYGGGVHGIDTTHPSNFGFVNGKPARFGIWDALKSDAASRRELQTLLLQKAMENPNTEWINEGMVNDFNEEQLNRFWVSERGLNFDFDPYELSSYAAGPFTFLLTFEELRPLIRPAGPIGRWGARPGRF